MPQDVLKRLAAVQPQLEKLDRLAEQTRTNLNTVAGAERVEKWEADTVAIPTHSVGRPEARKYAGVRPRPCSTNDLVEDMTELIECYPTSVVALAKQLSRVTP
jgi:hypothetical protein